ncbi:hypothetical protein [uncultured Kordia sp.]|uniref:hypothetical protein n=1 Tax=uncultured Kordia sp. TaxID=507699 RepID=UPI002622E948|nr:hypothetical protein [uncultured Kordia sp.]
MKKQKIKNLSLNKKSISNLAIKGGLPGYTWFCPKEVFTEDINCQVYEPYTSRDMQGALPSECESVPFV